MDSRRIVRLVILVTVSLFALLSMSLGAALIGTFGSFGPFFDIGFAGPGLAVAIGVITLLSVPVMIVLEILRPGRYFTSMIIFEVLWLGLLSILWLASGAAQAVENIFIGGACAIDSEADSFADSFDPGDSDSINAADPVNNICGEARAITAFSFLTWIILMVYTLTIMIMSCVATSRRRGRVWTESVANAPFSGSATTEKGTIPLSYTQSYPSVQEPTSGSVRTGAVQV
ncbi:hypothetical protein GGX14DRAFT_467107 [Mycena pura]|uniref:MARVEL domain-containing protein n=1 Tax=Mycena pura TaxID=153505 RepID=A0AAD6V4X8_9AGAR|nr:hypothetical protein GGX14DRAFT_467107 [Mycena pura]